jgi:hypothetical protein
MNNHRKRYPLVAVYYADTEKGDATHYAESIFEAYGAIFSRSKVGKTFDDCALEYGVPAAVLKALVATLKAEGFKPVTDEEEIARRFAESF